MNTKQFNQLLFGGLIALPLIVLCFINLWMAGGYALCIGARTTEQVIISKYGDKIQ